MTLVHAETSGPALKSSETAATRADAAECRELLRAGSKSFYAASLLLPRRLRCDVYALYAFCRIADDQVDASGGPKGAVVALRARLSALYAGGAPLNAVERAFVALVQRRDIPFALPAALIEGFDWDAEGRSYETLSDVRAYGVRVAGVVGIMMTILMGVRHAEALARACDLGVAMQLTNIARDVGDDARDGRLYLPREWFREEGLDAEAWLADPRPCPEIERMTKRLLIEADYLYKRSESGISLLPFDVRAAIWSARKIYAEIGAQIERNGYDNVTRRAVVTRSAKLRLIAAAMSSAIVSRIGDGEPPLAEAVAFIEGAGLRAAPTRRSVRRRVISTIELFHRLQEAERAAYESAARKRVV